VSDKSKKVSTNWIVFLLVALVCVVVAGAVLLRGGVVSVGRRSTTGGSGEVLTASTGWGTTHFSNLSAADIEATDLTTTGDVLVGDDLEVADFFQLQCGSVYSVTNGEDMMAASTYQELECAEWVTMCVGTFSGTEGDLQIFMNTCSNNITIQESVDAAMAGDFVMGQYDSIMFIYDGSRWIELSRTDN